MKRFKKLMIVQIYQFMNNLWSFIEVYVVFVPNLCGEKSVRRKSVWRKNYKYEIGGQQISFWKEKKTFWLRTTLVFILLYLFTNYIQGVSKYEFFEIEMSISRNLSHDFKSEHVVNRWSKNFSTPPTYLPLPPPFASIWNHFAVHFDFEKLIFSRDTLKIVQFLSLMESSILQRGSFRVDALMERKSIFFSDIT